jgi:hypothetical protein
MITVTVPLEVPARPVIIRSRVVFPAPFGPRRPVMPGWTPKVMSLTATTLPNQRDTPSTRITGVVMA